MKKTTFKSFWQRGCKGWIMSATYLLLMLGATKTFSQADLYSFVQSNGVYTPITGGTLITSATDYSPSLDSYSSGELTLPTAFNFAGTSYSTFYVTSNGQVQLGGSSAPSSFNYRVISSNTGNNVFLAPFSGDLGAGASGSATIRWEQVGDEVVIQWTNFRRYLKSESFNFQARLNTVTGVIKFVYDGTPPYAASTDYQPQLGIKSSTSNYVCLTVATDGDWNAPSQITTGVSGSSIASFNGALGFTSGLTYTFNPPPPCTGVPDGGTANDPAVRYVCAGATPSAITVSGASGLVEPGIAYQWQESTDAGANWANATGGTGATTASYTPAVYAGADIQYRLKVTCTNSAEEAYSTAVTLTPQIAPATQASALVTGNIGFSSMALSWTNGDGGRRMVVVSDTPITDPTDGVGIAAYAANSTFAGAGQQIVYDGTGTSVTVSGLSCGTMYYTKVYEYNRCGADPYNTLINVSTDTNALTVNVPGVAAALPVVNNFTDFVDANLGAVVPGWFEASITTSGGTAPTNANPSGVTSSWTGSTSLGVKTAKINLYTNTRNSWIISPKIALTVNSRLKFKAAISNYNSGGVDPEGMQGTDDKVNVLVSTDCGATWTSLYVFEAANTATLSNSLTDFTLPLTDFVGQTIQIGFQGTDGPADDAPDYDFHITNILVEETPSCDVPVVAAPASVTKNGVSLSWEAPTVGVPTGYEYAVVTTDTAPASGDMTTETSVDVTGLTPSTMYYVYVRTECTDVYSDWSVAQVFTTMCDYPEVLTTEGGSVCGQGEAELSATAELDGVLSWYDSAEGGTMLGQGESFTTPLVTETTDFYVSAGSPIADTDATLGAGGSTSSSGGSSPYYHGWGGVKTQYIIKASDLQAAGLSAGPINSIAFTITSLGTPTFNNFAVSVGTTTQSEATTTHVDGLTQVYTNAAQPLTVGVNTYAFTTPFAWDGSSNVVVQVCYSNVNFGGTSSTVLYDNAGYTGTTYTYADNQTAADICAATTGSVGESGNTTTSSNRAQMIINGTAICSSPRMAVTATVTDAPDVVLVASEPSICEGESTDISVSSDNLNYEYVWMPGNLAGAMQTVSPVETTTYVVTATDPDSGCVEVGEITIVVNPLPSAVSVTPDMADVCQNSVVALAATGGSTIIAQEYCEISMNNPGASGDYLNNFSFANIVNNASGDAAADYTYYSALTANVTGGDTYTVSMQTGSANWSQYLRIWIDYNQDGVYSEDESVFTTTSGVTSSTTVTADITIPTTAFNGTTRMRVLCSYDNQSLATSSCAWTGFGEYEEYNVNITGATNAVDYIWSPQAGLYSDEAATVPYMGEPAATVYYYATADANYTVTVTSEFGCSVSTSTDLTIVVTPAPTAEASQIFCAGATVADLTAEGEMVNWYYSATGGNALAETVMLNDATMYYATQTVNGCESVERVAVTATVNTTPSPAVDEYVQLICNSGTIADLMATGTDVQWYADFEGGEPLAPETELEAGVALYFASQTIDGCESLIRTPVAVFVNVVETPMADAQQTFCGSATVADLMADGDDIMWYADETGGEPLAAETELMDGGMYYAAMMYEGCESAVRAAVTVTITVVVELEGEQTQEVAVDPGVDAVIGDLVVTAQEGAEVNWYASMEDAMNGENPLSSDFVLTSGNTYYAVQSIGDCSSAPFAVTVSVTLDARDFEAANFSYWPNPVKDVLNISYSSSITSATVYNLLGQPVMSQQINALQGTINMSGLSDGSYIIIVKTDNASKTIKVIKKQ
ncbi:T9SS type A sorting domain-containing protein [Flavobacterium rakeshii]|uniref:T9SS type A sorting domain-containing protein n=1 Tax=Flavobacterium rakeshii TaxID=1038845 RepID=A0A6N8H6Q5_9FLAO|nr:GEVED domain-containing protein [Flavobacterium rakeshii]MUV02201.1 T9SS type A sorting domain-containing protein [Flavobacterium rakeshii]